jgi:hypothetical protein
VSRSLPWSPKRQDGSTRYAANFKEVGVREGKLVRGSSLTIGAARHWDEFIEEMK